MRLESKTLFIPGNVRGRMLFTESTNVMNRDFKKIARNIYTGCIIDLSVCRLQQWASWRPWEIGDQEPSIGSWITGMTLHSECNQGQTPGTAEKKIKIDVLTVGVRVCREFTVQAIWDVRDQWQAPHRWSQTALVGGYGPIQFQVITARILRGGCYFDELILSFLESINIDPCLGWLNHQTIDWGGGDRDDHVGDECDELHFQC